MMDGLALFFGIILVLFIILLVLGIWALWKYIKK